ncbi:unnamed protein product [Bursaphelenchus okinawaensis]|uniref:Uncharacterized protein n=1 Tax=Bursaphelenchus okinawaensis TaxID=465554 RepID=A0A811LFC0_9BILA|nr:unnamed protein product [Bursaphelenchus okinawaensis]CAG9121229.1 unnamed protein product [Bursaphelenchus okinawaensis]
MLWYPTVYLYPDGEMTECFTFGCIANGKAGVYYNIRLTAGIINIILVIIFTVSYVIYSSKSSFFAARAADMNSRMLRSVTIIVTNEILISAIPQAFPLFRSYAGQKGISPLYGALFCFEHSILLASYVRAFWKRPKRTSTRVTSVTTTYK